MRERCERLVDDDRRLSVATQLLRRRPGPPVAPKTRSIQSAVIGQIYPATAPSSTGSPSSSLEELSQPTAPPVPLSGVARQLIRDLERRQLQLRQRGILAVGEVLNVGGVEQ